MTRTSLLPIAAAPALAAVLLAAPLAADLAVFVASSFRVRVAASSTSSLTVLSGPAAAFGAPRAPLSSAAQARKSAARSLALW